MSDRIVEAHEGETVVIRWYLKDHNSFRQEYTCPPLATREARTSQGERMNTVDWLRRLRWNIDKKIDTKTSWGKVELRVELDKAYNEILEEIISQSPEIQR